MIYISLHVDNINKTQFKINEGEGLYEIPIFIQPCVHYKAFDII